MSQTNSLRSVVRWATIWSFSSASLRGYGELPRFQIQHEGKRIEIFDNLVKFLNLNGEEEKETESTRDEQAWNCVCVLI